jgi:hypothetical protein
MHQRWQRIRAIELLARWRMTVLASWSRQPMMACSWSQVAASLGLTANVVQFRRRRGDLTPASGRVAGC